MNKSIKTTLAVALLATTFLATTFLATTAFAGGDKPKDSVTFAKSWDAAVAEAKLLNVPIVVHNHGFY